MTEQPLPVAGLTARSATITVIAQAAARGITLVLVVLSTAVVTRAVGVDVYADWATVLSLVALTAFALDPGLSPVIVRRLAQNPAEAPKPAAMVLVRLVLSIAALLVVTVMTGALRGLGAVPLALVLGAQMVPRALVLNATAWLQADHRLHRQTALEAVCAVLGLAALVTVGALGGSAVLLALAGFTAPTALLAILIRRELARTPSAANPSPGPQGLKVRSLLREVAPLAGALVLVAVYTRIFVVFVNAAEDDVHVARYLFAFQFVEQIIVVAGIVAGALLPLLAVRATSRGLLEDRTTHDVLIAVTALGGLGCGVIVATAAVLCRLIGGPQLAPASDYLTILAPMAAIVLPAFVLGYVYVALGWARRYLVFNAIALVFNVAANAALTLSIGAGAAARITWITELLVVSCAMWPIARSGPEGRAVALRLLAITVACVAGSELAAAGLPRVAMALCIAAVAAAAGHHQLRSLVSRLRRA